MGKSKTELEFAFFHLKGKVITSVWYKGKCSIKSDYHATEEGLFLEFSDGDVFRIYPADEMKQKFIHGVYIKQIKHWEKEKKYFKQLENVTVEWKDYAGKEIQESRLNWKRIIDHKFSGGHTKSRTDYPHGLELRFGNGATVYLDTMRIVGENKKAYLGYPEITVFFNAEVRRLETDRLRLY